MIDSNTIQGTGGGVTLLADGAAAPGTGKVHLKITRNSMTNPGGGALAIRGAIELQAALSSPGGPNISVCTDIGGASVQNTISGNWGHGSSDSGIYLRQRFSAANSWICPDTAAPMPHRGRCRPISTGATRSMPRRSRRRRRRLPAPTQTGHAVRHCSSARVA